MNPAPIVLALAAMAFASGCISSPLDGQSLTIDGYPTLSVETMDTGLDLHVRVQMPQVSFGTIGYEKRRNPTAKFVTYSGDTNNTMPNDGYLHQTLDNCTLFLDGYFDVAQLLYGKGWTKVQDQQYNTYTWIIQVKWVDYVWYGNVRSADWVERSNTADLRFSVNVQRYATVYTNITFYSPVTLYALVKRMEIDLYPTQHITLTAEIRVFKNWNITLANLSYFSGDITGPYPDPASAMNLQLYVTDPTWAIYIATFTLAINETACTLSAGSSYNVTLFVQDKKSELLAYQVPLKIAMGESENWCTTNVTTVRVDGSQETYSDNLTTPSTIFWLNDTVTVSANFSSTPALPFHVVIANATATALNEYPVPATRETFTVDLTPFPCPYTYCFTFLLVPGPGHFLSLWQYEINVTYELVPDGGEKRAEAAAVIPQRYSMTSLIGFRNKGQQEEDKPGDNVVVKEIMPSYVVGIIGVLAGAAGLSIVVAIAAVGYFIVTKRRQQQPLSVQTVEL